jgi:hypothetical protein
MRQLVKASQDLRLWIQFLPDMDDACGMEAIFSQSLDRVARRIHDAWKKETDKKIREAELHGNLNAAAKHRAKEIYREWDELTEAQKDVNRLAADHLTTKIRAVGLDPSQIEVVEQAWVKMDARTLEMLSRMEHERWAAPYRMAGWRLGERDPVKRTHPNLLDYDALHNETKNYDRNQVANAAYHLKV